MKKQVVLTVSESKRLIAKAVAVMPEVKRAMREGMVVVATGTTNAYVLEELWGRRIDKRRYRSGITLPKEPEKLDHPQEEPIPDVVFRRGEVVRELDRFTAAAEMKAGDIYLKGANALDYNRKMAGVLIGSPTGGTVGAVLGHIIGKKVNLIIPVGLEKLVYGDINELHVKVSAEDSDGPSLWPLKGTIVTEIEALKILAGVDATLIAAGGVAGAEGAVRLIVEGPDEKLDAAVKMVESIRGEPRYLL